MKLFTKAIPAQKPKTSDSQKIIYLYVAILVIFVLCQLFKFDEFLELLASFSLPGGLTTARLLGSVVVVSEVLALPFLLRLKLSPLMRIISMILGWLVPAIWLFFALWLNLTPNSISNIGFLGVILDLIPGWWTVFISVALGILAAWASWSMWPLNSQKNHK
jgi:hypothetical protein